jgi:hypothetical protein
VKESGSRMPKAPSGNNKNRRKIREEESADASAVEYKYPQPCLFDITIFKHSIPLLHHQG